MDTREDAATGANLPPPDARLAALLAAGVQLLASLRSTGTSLLALCRAEARVAAASVTLTLLTGVALLAFSVSLWACVVALIGWALLAVTHSLGIALAILIVLHGLLVAASWLLIRRLLRHAAFPHSRMELTALRRDLHRNLARFQQAAPPSRSEPSE